mmetsp:Transcript_6506/g.9879  ORF Transcript_6506/g.9879 Transcript_6506/m.9879 type:complete len:135 (+) Transcript_6506:180-584(+)
MICEDFGFYWGHRLLHSKLLYPKIHKIHHEYNVSIGLCAIHMHPVEYFISGIIPTSSCMLILNDKMHIWTFYLYVLFQVWEVSDAHCGYEFPWSPGRLLPFMSSAEVHDYHHEVNIGNYGSWFRFWDTICGTNS